MEAEGRAQGHNPRQRYVEVRHACWEFPQAWSPASSPGSGPPHQPRKGCHTGMCWRAVGLLRAPGRRERLGTWLALGEEVQERRRRRMWRRHGEGKALRVEVFSARGQETWVVLGMVLEVASFE